jgi:hypothetical protein
VTKPGTNGPFNLKDTEACFPETRDSSDKLAASPAKMAAIGRSATRADNPAEETYLFAESRRGRAKDIPAKVTFLP